MKKKYLLCIILFVLVISTILFFCGFRKANSQKSEGIIILAYHHFLPRSDKEKYYKDNYYVMPTEQFEEQMKYLKENGYNCITPDIITCYLNNDCEIPDKAFIITIDDGNISSYYEALPIIEKYGFYAINFVISGRISNEKTILSNSDLTKFYYLDKDTLNDIYYNHSNMIIGAHSDSLHDQDKDGKKYFELKDYEELLFDSKKSKEALNDTIFMAYPYGSTNKDYKKAVKNAGFEFAFSFNNNMRVNQNSDKYELPRYNVRADMSLKDFSLLIEDKLSLKNYTKRIIKQILNR